MPLNVDVHVELEPVGKVNPDTLALAALRTLEHQGITDADVSVVVAGHSLVRDLNVRYLEHDYNTDVLSFTLSDATDRLEGEVYIDVEMAAERCAEFGTSIEQESMRYVIHGVLHLTGHDDSTPALKADMTSLEDAILLTISPSDAAD